MYCTTSQKRRDGQQENTKPVSVFLKPIFKEKVNLKKMQLKIVKF